ncbi:hypothetical protein [Larkinella rosea]|uniref:Uncharacterized protein n=1 Tax=Larkinella rosea TaxID=2025312 RepID=A0A3P1BUW7_9BACT|nr:hypothetical protein [Larkinella rosea]RRB04699.1 hypothetical protein EHT25_14610 [Larkinella rosea]
MAYDDSDYNIFEIFKRNKVEYMVVGGFAVSYYGDYRKSINQEGKIVDKPDLDFWYNPSYVNYYRLLDALQELGRDVTKFKEEASPDPKRSVFKYEFEDYTLDLLPIIKAPLKFSKAYARRKVIESNGIESVLTI